MDDRKEEVAAWMEAQSLVIKAKNVLVEEAIELLYREIDAKRMTVEGSFVRMSDKEGEMEQGMFLIQNLMTQKDRIVKDFSETIRVLESKPEELTPEKGKTLEDAKKFIAAVEKISECMDYSMVFDGWFDEVSMRISDEDPAFVLADTCFGDPTGREEALRYLAGTPMYNDDAIFSVKERGIINKALKFREEGRGA